MERFTTTTNWPGYPRVIETVVETDIPDNAAAVEKDTLAASGQDAFLMTEALRIARNTPDIRQDKVTAIKARIANGTYEVDAAAIALALIRDEMDFIGS